MVRVGVGVPVGHTFWLNMTSNPLLRVPPQGHAVHCAPVPLCMPSVAAEPLPLMLPYTKSMRGPLSYRRTSKFAGRSGPLLNTARHSMLNMRLGLAPDTEVKMPQPLAKAEHPTCASVLRLRHNAMIALLKPASGRQTLAPEALAELNCTVLLVPMLALLKAVP